MPVPGIELSVELHPGVDDMSGLLFVLCNGAAPLLDDLFRLLPDAEKGAFAEMFLLDSQQLMRIWILHLNADTYPAFHLNADPDPAYH